MSGEALSGLSFWLDGEWDRHIPGGSPPHWGPATSMGLPVPLWNVALNVTVSGASASRSAVTFSV